MQLVWYPYLRLRRRGVEVSRLRLLSVFTRVTLLDGVRKKRRLRFYKLIFLWIVRTNLNRNSSFRRLFFRGVVSSFFLPYDLAWAFHGSQGLVLVSSCKIVSWTKFLLLLDNFELDSGLAGRRSLLMVLLKRVREHFLDLLLVFFF